MLSHNKNARFIVPKILNFYKLEIFSDSRPPSDVWHMYSMTCSATPHILYEIKKNVLLQFILSIGKTILLLFLFLHVNKTYIMYVLWICYAYLYVLLLVHVFLVM